MKNLSFSHIQVLLPIALLAAIAAPIFAQGRGPTPIGRRGATWQHGIDQAEEQQARLLTDLGRLTEEEWQAKALAWVRFETDGESKPSAIDVNEAHRVGDIWAKKADIARHGDEETPTWQISFAKKPPKTLTLVLTDVNSTEVECTTNTAIDAGSGHLGVFVDQGTLFCLAREKGDA